MVTVVLVFTVGQVDEPRTEEAWAELYEWLGSQHRLRFPGPGPETDDRHWKEWSQDQGNYHNFYETWDSANKSSGPAMGVKSEVAKDSAQ